MKLEAEAELERLHSSLELLQVKRSKETLKNLFEERRLKERPQSGGPHLLAYNCSWIPCFMDCLIDYWRELNGEINKKMKDLNEGQEGMTTF